MWNLPATTRDLDSRFVGTPTEEWLDAEAPRREGHRYAAVDDGRLFVGGRVRLARILRGRFGDGKISWKIQTGDDGPTAEGGGRRKRMVAFNTERESCTLVVVDE